MSETPPVRKKLIEVSIPLEAINAASAREKSIRHGHPSTLHLWWARRPLAACRAVLFAQLVDDPSSWPERFDHDEAKIDVERKRLHKIIVDMVPWEASNDETILNAARWEIARSVAWGLGEEPPPKDDGKAILDYLQTKAPPVYDPFSGGGSIPLEAQRLGVRAYGSDLNPVAVLIGKALVEIPPKFADCPPVNPKSQAALKRGGHWSGKGTQGLAEDVRYYGQWIRDEVENRIGHLYPKAKLEDGSEATVIAWLWTRTVRSPDPSAKGAMVPLIGSFLLSASKERKTWYEILLDEKAPDGWRVKVHSGSLTKNEVAELGEGTVGRKGAVCALTGSPMSLAYIRSEGRAGRLGIRLIGVIADTRSGRAYLEASSDQEKAAAEAIGADLPELEQEISHNPRDIKTPTYGMRRWKDLFTLRQAQALATFCELTVPLAEIIRRDISTNSQYVATIEVEEYIRAICTYLSFAIDKGANYWSSVCTWNANREAIVSTFGRQAIAMAWDFSETNPFSQSTGNFLSGVESCVKSLAIAPACGQGRVIQLDARLGSTVFQNCVVETDPPYFDCTERVIP